MKTTLCILLASSLVALPRPAAALERHPARWPDEDRPDVWVGSASCTVRYYNVCNGWLWVVGRLWFKDFGMLVEPCCEQATLASTWQYVFTRVPQSGYPHSAMVHLSAVDAAGCPVEPPLASQPYQPDSGWNLLGWNVPVPSRFAIHAYMPGYYYTNSLEVALDYPGAGPTGPAACGSCYPATRENRSFYFAADQAPLCPPEPMLLDGSCFAQLLWDCSLVCPTAVEAQGWARVKAMYR